MSRQVRYGVCALAAAFLAAASGAAQQAAPLPLGKVDAGTSTSDRPATYEFKATTAGLLSVAIQGEGDLALLVTDQDGQAVPEGSADRDLFGSAGSEQVLVTITEPGLYRVQVRLLDGAGKFQIGASWISFPGRARPSDPDKRPASARALETGRTHEDSLDSESGDSWDWFVFTPKMAGTLTVILRPLSGAEGQIDLQLEIFTTSDFAKPTLRSDQDLQNNPANESGTVDVTAGQKVYVKVSGASGSTSGKYRLSSSLIQ
jgi:hypothetical protein